MAYVVLAITEGPLTVFPGLTPMDGGEADVQLCRQIVGGKTVAALKVMIVTDIVV